MAEPQTGWAERSARLEHERAVASRERLRVGERPVLATIANLEELEERRLYVAAGADIDEVSHGQTMRAAVNDLQHRLLLLDPQADVYDLALERLMTAAGADRVCAFLNSTDADGQQAVRAARRSGRLARVEPDRRPAPAEPRPTRTSPRASSRGSMPGEPFGSRTEFLPGRTAARLAAQGVEATLLLPLFVGGAFRGFLRLDRCDRARLWSEGETGILVSAAGSISAAIERQQVVAKLVQRSHELAALLTTSRAITSSIDYDVVLQEVACAAAEALVCPRERDLGVLGAQRRGDVQGLLPARSRVRRRLRTSSARPTTRATIRAACARCATRIVADQSLSDEDLSCADRARMTQRGEKTRLSVPLVYGDEVLGMMILVETERERRFTPDEVRMARVIGEQAAAALHNARLHRREEDQHRWLAALAEATRVIGSRLDRVELLRDVAGLATKALLVDRALVYEWDEHDAAFTLRAADGGHVAVRTGAQMPPSTTR